MPCAPATGGNPRFRRGSLWRTMLDRATVALVVSDLMFQARIVDALRALGADVRLDPGGATRKPRPHAIVVDLQEPGVDVAEVIADAHLSGTRVLAFGRHTDAAALRAAREAGADAVVPRSQLVDGMRELLESLLAPNPGTGA